MSQTTPPTYRQLLAAGEPFRLLFPLGVLFGLTGVLLWPAYVWGGMDTYPVLIHTRIMIECFLASFVIGFLGTALPRLLDVPKVHGREAMFYAVGLTASFALHLISMHTLGDLLFLLTFGSFVASLALRARVRKDMPPPAFVLVLIGLLCALAGTVSFLLAAVWKGGPEYQLYQAGRLLLYQGFLLFPIMGVGAFLLPRFFDLPNQQNFPESLAPPPGWWRSASFAFVCGLLGLLSFALEYLQYLPAAYLLRASALLLYFWREVPVHKAKFSNGSLAMALRVALFSIPLGYIAMALLPARQITLLHIVFITGFSLLTLTVATRVIFGHGGRSELFPRTLWSIRALVALIVLAMATRVSADWMPDVRLTHYAYAALAWAAAVIVWAVCVLPGVRNPDD
ncbi:NnrS family protein [Coraliomargarita sp. W4R53]